MVGTTFWHIHFENGLQIAGKAPKVWWLHKRISFFFEFQLINAKSSLLKVFQVLKWKYLRFFVFELLLESNSAMSSQRGPRLFNQFMQQASTIFWYITGWARNVNFLLNLLLCYARLVIGYTSVSLVCICILTLQATCMLMLESGLLTYSIWFKTLLIIKIARNFTFSVIPVFFEFHKVTLSIYWEWAVE